MKLTRRGLLVGGAAALVAPSSEFAPGAVELVDPLAAVIAAHQRELLRLGRMIQKIMREHAVPVSVSADDYVFRARPTSLLPEASP